MNEGTGSYPSHGQLTRLAWQQHKLQPVSHVFKDGDTELCLLRPRIR